MCNHSWLKFGECLVCIKCGITKLPNGQIYFDREMVSYCQKKEKKKKKKR